MKSSLLVAVVALSCAGMAQAQGVIDQNRVLAGSITPGDTPGFPVSINQPGYYKLSGHLVVPAGMQGIVISVPNVTLDLNGYSISGPNTCTQNPANKLVSCTQAANPAINGVTSSQRNTQVKNGLVRGFAGSGVHLTLHGRIEQLQLSENGSYGAYMPGGEIATSMAELNVNGGLVAGGGRVMDSRAWNNAGFGLVGTLVANCMAMGNVVGIDGTAVRDSVAVSNQIDVLGAMSLGGNLKGSSPY